MPIGSRIREIRGALSRDAFAVKLRVDGSTIQRYETADNIPKGDVLERIHQEFGVNLNWLLTGEGEPYINKDRAGEFRMEDKEGLWARTEEKEIGGIKTTVQVFEPKRPRLVKSIDPFAQAVGGLRRIFKGAHQDVKEAILANINAFQITAEFMDAFQEMEARLVLIEKILNQHKAPKDKERRESWSEMKKALGL